MFEASGADGKVKSKRISVATQQQSNALISLDKAYVQQQQ